LFVCGGSVSTFAVGHVAILVVATDSAVALVLGVLAVVLVGLAPEHASGAAGIGGGVGAIMYGCLRRWGDRDRPPGGGSS
jgi:hypothetical protein